MGVGMTLQAASDKKIDELARDARALDDFIRLGGNEDSANGAAMGTIDNVPPGSAMTNQQGTATPVGYAEAPRDNGIVPTLMWLVPLLVAVALLFPLARKWWQRRNTDVTVRPRV